MVFFTKQLALIAALPLTGCIFNSGGEATDPNPADPDTGMDVGNGMFDASTPPIDMAQTADVGRPSDMGGGMVDMPPDRPDMGAPGFRFQPFQRHRIVVPYRQTFLDNPPSETPDNEDQVHHTQLSIVWSSQVDYVLSTDPIPAGTDLALISTDADPAVDAGLTGTPWENPAVPMWVLSRSAFNDTFLMDGDTFDVANPEIRVVDSLSALSLGLPDRFVPYTDDTENVSSRRDQAPGSAPLEFTDLENNTRIPVLGVEAQTMMLDGEIAGARRVADGIDEADVFTWESWLLSDNIAAYLLNDPLPFQPIATCRMLLGGQPTPLEFRIASRMRRNGCDVRFGGMPAGPDEILVIAPTATGPVALPARMHPGPVLGFINATTPTALDIAPPTSVLAVEGNEWVMDLNAPPGLRANNEGSVTVSSRGSMQVETNTIASGAQIIAGSGEASSATYLVVQQGAALMNGSAAGDRALLGIGPAMWASGTPDGIDFFDAALQWLIWRRDNR